MSIALYKMVLIASIFLILAGIFLTAFSLFSPLWQESELPELDVTHQHGLWWDCVISHGNLIPLADLNSMNMNPHSINERCMSKFDPDATTLLRQALEKDDKASKEIMQHRFLPHHKAVVFFSVFTFLFGLIGMVIGGCSPCFPPNSILYVVSIFMTCACSVLADVIFLFAAIKEENDHIVPYKSRLGIACFVHMVATAIFILALVFSVASAYLLITSNRGQHGCFSSKKEYVQQQRWGSSGLLMRQCDRNACRPFVVIDDDTL